MANKAKEVKSTKSTKNANAKKTVKTAKAKTVKNAKKKTDKVVKEEVIVRKSLKWVYPADCTSHSDRKAFRTQARAKIAKWDKLLTDGVDSKGKKLKKAQLKDIKLEKSNFIAKFVNKNYAQPKQWVE